MTDRDRLMEAAFDGDGTFLGNLSTSEARELDLLKGVKRDIVRLKEVPECQLTADRLKNAILARSTVPARKAPRWIWAPSVAAVAIAVFAMTRPVNPGPEARPSDGRSLAATPVDGPPATGPDHSTVPAGEAVAMTDPGTWTETVDLRSEGGDRASSPAMGRRSSSSRPRVYGGHVRTLGAAPDVAALRDTIREATFDSSGRADSGTGPAADKTAAEAAAAEPVVVVSPDANPETGVSDALEVSRPKDVLFGG